MQVVSGGRSVWIYTLLFTSLLLWRSLSASKPCATLPQPTLDIYLKSKDSAVLVCRSPQGYQGIVFMLYRLREKMDSWELQFNATEVQFTVNVKEGDSGQGELFCCLYQDHKGCYSAFSPYLKLEHQRDDAPSPSTPSFPPPVLSVEPSSGVVKRGDMLSFSCSVPAYAPQSQSGFKNKPLTFLLLRTAEQTGATSVIQQPQASQVASPEPQPGVFSVGPVRGGEEGEYSCLYQITNKGKLVNTTVSNTVQVTFLDMLPQPTLVLQQQTDVWHLLCTGSPSYPGAVFSLYLVDNELPVATQHAKAIHHQATFPIPVQDSLMALYQCQYSVLLGSNWSYSERSPPLAAGRGTSSPSSDMSGVDWPLVLGSFSAVVLFLCSVALMVVVTHSRVKAAAEKKKKRQEAQFWSRVHARDHVADLTLRRSSFSSQEWTSGDNDMTPRAPLWNSLSTFTTPIHPH